MEHRTLKQYITGSVSSVQTMCAEHDVNLTALNCITLVWLIYLKDPLSHLKPVPCSAVHFHPVKKILTH